MFSRTEACRTNGVCETYATAAEPDSPAHSLLCTAMSEIAGATQRRSCPTTLIQTTQPRSQQRSSERGHQATVIGSGGLQGAVGQVELAQQRGEQTRLPRPYRADHSRQPPEGPGRSNASRSESRRQSQPKVNRGRCTHTAASMSRRHSPTPSSSSDAATPHRNDAQRSRSAPSSPSSSPPSPLRPCGDPRDLSKIPKCQINCSPRFPKVQCKLLT